MNILKKVALVVLYISTGSLCAKSHLEKAFLSAIKHAQRDVVAGFKDKITRIKIFKKGFKKAAKNGDLETCLLLEDNVSQEGIDKGVRKAAKYDHVNICQRFWKKATPVARMKAKVRLGTHRTPAELEKLNLPLE